MTNHIPSRAGIRPLIFLLGRMPINIGPKFCQEVHEESIHFASPDFVDVYKTPSELRCCQVVFRMELSNLEDGISIITLHLRKNLEDRAPSTHLSHAMPWDPVSVLPRGCQSVGEWQNAVLRQPFHSHQTGAQTTPTEASCRATMHLFPPFVVCGSVFSCRIPTISRTMRYSYKS